MQQYLSILILMGFHCWQILYPAGHTGNDPLHFMMSKEYEAAVKREAIFTFQGKDTLLSHQVFLLSDEEGFPLLYYADILTPVCIDNICKPMSIEIYWNLLGAYVGYGIFPEEPLTKFDHDLFEEADYKKLHKLLLDRHSILDRRALSDLFDADLAANEKVKFKGQEVDAVSGATKKEIKESVVEGALYSCYTIWHIVHGEAAQKMARKLEQIYTPLIGEYFLYSSYQNYQMYALKHFDAAAFVSYLPRILEIFGDAKPVTRRYILKKLPKASWAEEKTSIQLYQGFADLDINSQTLLINNLEHAHPTVVELLANGVSSMTKNQLRAYLKHLTLRSEYKREVIWAKLEKVVEARQYSYYYLIEDFLKEK